MQRILLALFTLLAVSCSKSPMGRAKSLIAKKTPFEIQEITNLDSIVDYPESFQCTLKAATARYNADSILQENLPILIEMKEEGMISEMTSLANITKDCCTNLIRTAASYDSDAITIRFKKDISRDESPIFLGYKCSGENESHRYTFYFDKEVSNITGVDVNYKVDIEL